MAPGSVSRREMVDSTALLEEPDALRDRYVQQGYVLVRGLLDLARLDAVTEDFSSALRSADWAEPLTAEPRAPLIPHHSHAGEQRDLGRERELYRRLFSSEALHRLPHDDGLGSVVATLLATTAVLVHPKPAIRVVVPDPSGGGGDVTPAHEDHLGMQGTPSTLTAWMPLSDCPRALGPIEVAEASHRDGVRRYRPTPGARVLCCAIDDLDGAWVGADLRAGDVVVFSSLMVHRAPANRSSVVRMSVDCRFQSAHEPVCAAALRADPDCAWDALYDGFTDAGETVRGWQSCALDVVEFDPAYHLAPGPARSAVAR